MTGVQHNINRNPDDETNLISVQSIHSIELLLQPKIIRNFVRNFFESKHQQSVELISHCQHLKKKIEGNDFSWHPSVSAPSVFHLFLNHPQTISAQRLSAHREKQHLRGRRKESFTTLQSRKTTTINLHFAFEMQSHCLHFFRKLCAFSLALCISL